MYKVYTHPNLAILASMKGLLETYNIQADIQNQYAQGAIGELSFIDSWPELWVKTERDYIAAKNILKTDDEHHEDWTCQQCNELNNASFDFCWKCSHQASAP